MHMITGELIGFHRTGTPRRWSPLGCQSVNNGHIDVALITLHSATLGPDIYTHGSTCGGVNR